MKQLLVNLAEWLNEVHVDRIPRMTGSSLLAHYMSVSMWLTQLQDFAWRLKEDAGEARDRVISLAEKVSEAGKALSLEVDARLPPRPGLLD